MDEIVEMDKNTHEYTVCVKIIDDEGWEPDEDFFVELYDPNSATQAKLPGDDTRTKVTILDDDQPGILGFEERHIKVKRKDKNAYLKIIRTEGSDGTIKCKCQTEVLQNIENQAQEFTDFCPFLSKSKCNLTYLYF